ncbi:hypothetical protein DRE_04250 [Drechslerella stenobrocha 248]|uniref:SIS domain-containing protein n=1 Tax=Drechslerella stenobrocha 248 TaxID=1043628 RepID=W7I2E7_9PEZI|nr:hypothetical protein DRE_04250 [Drechslerella stenobrocha 248]
MSINIVPRLLESLPPLFNIGNQTPSPSHAQPCTMPLASPPSTPPLANGVSNSEAILDLAVHVLTVEATSLTHLARAYAVNASARTSFVAAVQAIVRSLSAKGKVIFIGVGKSGKVAQKTVATMNGLGLLSCFLHPTEALHGDMGVIRAQDTVVLVSNSGTTAELAKVLTHVPARTAVVVMTAHPAATANSSDVSCPLTKGRESAILLPTPVHEGEEVTFGVSVPTTSTTVAMALGDALALAVADTMHNMEGRRTKDVFHSFHPGGAIGRRTRGRTLADLAVDVRSMPVLADTSVKVGECLMQAFRAPGGWVRVGRDGHAVVPPRRLKVLEDSNALLLATDAAVPREAWVKLDGAMKLEEVGGLVKGGQVIWVQLPDGSGFVESDDIL